MNDPKVLEVEDFKAQTINDYDRKDIITKQGVDKAFLNKVNRNFAYKRKMGQTIRRYNYETLERLKESYQNIENERTHSFSSDYEGSKFNLEDFSQILENDIGDLMDSTPENNKKIQELQNILRDMYAKHKIQKEPPKDLNELINLWQHLQNQGKEILKDEKEKEREKAAKEIKIIKVEDYNPNEEPEVIKIDPKAQNEFDID